MKSNHNHNHNHKIKKNTYIWILQITLYAFLISIGFSYISSFTLEKAHILVAIIVLVVIIMINIIFDVLGLATATADIKPFHSMSAKKVKGAKTAIFLIANAEKVASICNDVIGDIAGIISGSSGFVISVSISNSFSFNPVITTLISTGIIAALTIGGKAIGKVLAVNKANDIVFLAAKIISFFIGEKNKNKPKR